jgi:hypothetical protein
MLIYLSFDLFGCNQKGPKGKLGIPLEPSQWILLENPFHKSPRGARSGYWITHLLVGQ